MKLKQWQNIFHVTVNVNSIVQHEIQIKNENNGTCQCDCKNSCTRTKNYDQNPSSRVCENDKYLKSIVDTSIITSDEIISVMDIVSTKWTNTIPTNVLTNCHNKKVRYEIDCPYFVHSFISYHITFNN